jgi:DNA modification methylase
MSSECVSVKGDCLAVIPTLEDEIDLVIADPPYSEFPLINDAITLCRSVCKGASFFFMYAEDIFHLEDKPDQILFWTKPVSTKNTTKRYSRFVEVVCAYDLAKSPFVQDTHWSTRTGIFTDTLIGPSLHPFEKPVSLIQKLIMVNSKPGDLILEPFGGSEPVRRVCEGMDRRSISIEVDHG